MDSIDDFHITLFSNDSVNFFPENTLSQFENRIPTHIDLTENDWKVGLSEIFINDYLQTDIFKKETDILIDVGVLEIRVGANKQHVRKRIAYTFYPAAKAYFKANDWKVNFLPTLLNNIVPTEGYTRQEVIHAFLTEIYVTISNDKTYEVTHAAVPEANHSKFVRISKSFEENSFYLEPGVGYDTKSLIGALFKQQKNIKNYKKIIIDLFEKTKNAYNDKKNGMLLVYSDIIRPEIFGNNKIRALRAINVENCRNTNEIQFKHIQYVPLERKNFETIAIRIADQYGKDIDFVSSFHPTKIVLHFKNFTSKSI